MKRHGTSSAWKLQGSASFDRWSVSMIYGNYAAQPELGFLTRREGILDHRLDQARLELGCVRRGVRYDLQANKVNQYIIGAGYVDDCFVLAVNYITDYSYTSLTTTTPTLDHRVMLQIGLRTIGTTSFNQNVGGGNSIELRRRGGHTQQSFPIAYDLMKFSSEHTDFSHDCDLLPRSGASLRPQVLPCWS